MDVRHIAELYPDGKFDIKAEQEALAAADTIILQFPVYWYAYPALLKKYIDDVFAHGFAHGSTGTRLKGKTLIVSCTTGAPYDAYAEGGIPEPYYGHIYVPGSTAGKTLWYALWWSCAHRRRNVYPRCKQTGS